MNTIIIIYTIHLLIVKMANFKTNLTNAEEDYERAKTFLRAADERFAAARSKLPEASAVTIIFYGRLANVSACPCDLFDLFNVLNRSVSKVTVFSTAESAIAIEIAIAENEFSNALHTVAVAEAAVNKAKAAVNKAEIVTM